MILDLLVIAAVAILVFVDYFTYRSLKKLVFAQNSLMLYHHYFLHSKYEDYGEEPDD
jgi:hypothetical protein